MCQGQLDKYVKPREEPVFRSASQGEQSQPVLAMSFMEREGSRNRAFLEKLGQQVEPCSAT